MILCISLRLMAILFDSLSRTETDSKLIVSPSSRAWKQLDCCNALHRPVFHARGYPYGRMRSLHLSAQSYVTWLRVSVRDRVSDGVRDRDRALGYGGPKAADVARWVFHRLRGDAMRPGSWRLTIIDDKRRWPLLAVMMDPCLLLYAAATRDDNGLSWSSLSVCNSWCRLQYIRSVLTTSAARNSTRQQPILTKLSQNVYISMPGWKIRGSHSRGRRGLPQLWNAFSQKYVSSNARSTFVFVPQKNPNFGGHC